MISKLNPQFRVGQRYTYMSKETCIMVSKKARDLGYDVTYGTDDFGMFYFEIVDPFL